MPKLPSRDPTLDDFHSELSGVKLEFQTSELLEVLPPRSEQNFLKALAYLDLAMAEVKLADYHRMGNQ